MARLLTVHNAELNTASITIRTLQIEGRQVTLAVFRQLPEEYIINFDVTPSLKGVGWGHVNYMVEGSYRYSGRTIHLVWQSGNELRRCLVYQSIDVREFSFYELPNEATTSSIEGNRKIAENYAQKDANIHDHYLALAQKGEQAQIKWKADRAAAWSKHQEDKRWAAARDVLVAPLFDLPQLFIAV
jgi:hypothetical protein